MLFELLPHFARLMPMADKYLSSRSASEKTQEAALASLAGEVRGELGKVTGEIGKVTEANAGVSRQLQEQSRQIADMGVEVARTRMGVESAEARIAKLEKTAAATKAMLGGAVGLLAAVFVLLIVLVVRGMR
jgi:septal ring factor EnvC (AmiA/AmiB activator)